MKHLLLLALAFCTTIIVSAQITLIDPVNLAAGDPAVAADDILAVHWSIENTGPVTLNLRVRREVISFVDGARERFCWGPLCYPWDTEVSFPNDANIVEMTEGAIENSFFGDYEHNGNLGTSVIRYTFFDNNIDGIFTAYDVTYCVQDDPSNCVVSVSEVDVNTYLGNISPNPVSDQGALMYQMDELKADAKLVVYNMIGEVMMQEELDTPSGELNLSFDEIPNGVYFYAIINGGHSVATKKLVVSK